MNCEQVEERLSAYLDNVLTSDERREITIHLQACSRCMMLLAELRQNDILLAQLPRVSPSSALHERIFSTPEMLELAKMISSQPFFSINLPNPRCSRARWRVAPSLFLYQEVVVSRNEQ